MIEELFDLQTEMKMLDASLREFRNLGSKYAHAEHDYKIELSKKVLQLRADGQPATLIQLLAYGDKEVARKRLERDIAQTVFEACKEAINVKKLKIKVMQDQINKEYYNE